jgi:N utilization substance protein B
MNHTPANGDAHRAGREGARRRARLATVQALYQMELTSLPVAAVVDEFVVYRFPAAQERTDDAFFDALVRGVVERQVAVDRGLAKVLMAGWELERLDSTLRALLRAGAFELLYRPDVPARVVLSEYVEIADAFFSGQETGFANGVLDRIAHTARPDEFAAGTQVGGA